MALCIKSICRAKDQEFIKAWIPKRFLTSRAELNFPAKPSLKSLKPRLTQWNSYLELNGTQYFSTTSFHCLAMNIVNHSFAYTNVNTRNFADDKAKPSAPHNFSGIKIDNSNARLEQELSRLRLKGAMSEIPTKIPEGIKGIDGRKKE